MRFIMIGGFLGAGKTTAIARLAKHYVDAGCQVGVVTNDQAYDLVDTHALRAQGFRVGEVPGACFCCKFDDLLATVDRLASDSQPDVILTEPVGSCTDLMATVIEPLRHLHGNRFELAPLAVLLKPEHGRRILACEQRTGFSPQAEYIFLKQLEEADLAVINKIDTLDHAAQEELAAQLRSRFGDDKEILLTSGKTGAGFERLIACLETGSRAERPTLEIDYDIYAAGEAELGWLNLSAHVQANQAAFALDGLLVSLVSAIAQALQATEAETAHLKVLGNSGIDTGVANLVASDQEVELSRASGQTVPQADLVVNARVATDPEQLAEIALRSLGQVCREQGLSFNLGSVQHFRPGRPVPTHRMVR